MGEKNKVFFTEMFEQESGKQEKDAPVFAKQVTSLFTLFDKSKAVPSCFWGSTSAALMEELEKAMAAADKITRKWYLIGDENLQKNKRVTIFFDWIVSAVLRSRKAARSMNPSIGGHLKANMLENARQCLGLVF